MPLLDKTFLTTLGIQLSDQEYELLSKHFETTLYNRVINEIVEELSPEQARELTRYQNSTEEELGGWLQKNIKDLPEIVSDEVDILLGELAENSADL